VAQAQHLLAEFALREQLVLVDRLSPGDRAFDLRVVSIREVVIQIVGLDAADPGQHGLVEVLLALLQGLLLPLDLVQLRLVLGQTERLQRPLAGLAIDPLEEVGIGGRDCLDPLVDPASDPALPVLLLGHGKSGHLDAPCGLSGFGMGT